MSMSERPALARPTCPQKSWDSASPGESGSPAFANSLSGDSALRLEWDSAPPRPPTLEDVRLDAPPRAARLRTASGLSESGRPDADTSDVRVPVSAAFSEITGRVQCPPARARGLGHLGRRRTGRAGRSAG